MASTAGRGDRPERLLDRVHGDADRPDVSRLALAVERPHVRQRMVAVQQVEPDPLHAQHAKRPLHGSGDLLLGRPGRLFVRPCLAADEDAVAHPQVAESASEHGLRIVVHRGGVQRVHARFERRGEHVVHRRLRRLSGGVGYPVVQPELHRSQHQGRYLVLAEAAVLHVAGHLHSLAGMHLRVQSITVATVIPTDGERLAGCRTRFNGVVSPNGYREDSKWTIDR